MMDYTGGYKIGQRVWWAPWKPERPIDCQVVGYHEVSTGKWLILSATFPEQLYFACNTIVDAQFVTPVGVPQR